MRTATASPLSRILDAHANSFGWNLGSLIAVAGIMMMVMIRHAILIALPTELKFRSAAWACCSGKRESP